MAIKRVHFSRDLVDPDFPALLEDFFPALFFPDLPRLERLTWRLFLYLDELESELDPEAEGAEDEELEDG